MASVRLSECVSRRRLYAALSANIDEIVQPVNPACRLGRDFERIEIPLRD
jgi:hypothetical protein